MDYRILAVTALALLGACQQSPAPPPLPIAPAGSAPSSAPARDPALPPGALFRLGTPAVARVDPRWLAADTGGALPAEGDVPQRRWAPDATPTCAAELRGEGLVVAGFDDGTVTLWKGSSPRNERTLVGHVAPISAVGLSPDGGALVSASEDGEVRVWDTADGHLQHTHGMAGAGATELRFADGGRTLLAASLERVRRWSLDDGRDLDPGAAHLEGVERIVVSSKGWAASCDGGPVVLRWDLATGERSVLAGHMRGVTDLAVTPTGDVLASTSLDCTVRFWKDGLPTARAANGRHYDGSLCAAFDEAGAVIVVGDKWGQIRSWRTNDGEFRGRWTMHQAAKDWHDYGVRDIAWAPGHGRFATAGDDGHIAVWPDADPDTCLVRRELGDSRDLAFTPDGAALLVLHGEAREIAMLDATTLATLAQAPGVGWRSASLSPAGTWWPPSDRPGIS